MKINNILCYGDIKLFNIPMELFVTYKIYFVLELDLIVCSFIKCAVSRVTFRAS